MAIGMDHHGLSITIMCYAVNLNNLYCWYSDRKDTFTEKQKLEEFSTWRVSRKNLVKPDSFWVMDPGWEGKKLGSVNIYKTSSLFGPEDFHYSSKCAMKFQRLYFVRKSRLEMIA